MSKSKTFWVSRDTDGPANVLSIWESPPKWEMTRTKKLVGIWVQGEWESRSEVLCEHYIAIGLLQEPFGGECWEVTWNEFRPAGQLDNPIMIPKARNVTQELKKKK